MSINSVNNLSEIQGLLEQAQTALNMGNLLKAETLCQNVLDLEPVNPVALLLMGILNGLQNRLEESRKWLNKAYDSAPNDQNYLVQLASALGHVGLQQKVVNCWETVSKLQPQNERVLTNLGAAQCMNGDYQAAIVSLNEAVLVNPGCTEAWLNLGIVYKLKGITTKAESCFRKVLDLEPRHEKACASLGDLLQLDGRVEEAITVYNEGLLVAPHSASLCFGLYGATFEVYGEDKSAQLLEKAVAGNPEHFLARTHLGIMQDLLGNRDQAEKHFMDIQNKSEAFAFNIESWYYARDHRNTNTRLFTLSNSGLAYAVSHAAISGSFLEFGVWQGRSINFISSLTDRTVHGFDSFEGIPEGWEGMPSGSYSTHGKFPEVNSNVLLHKGWFEDSVPVFEKENDEQIAFMNIDCDTYQSTKTIFDILGNRIQVGTVIVFDEYFCFPNWQKHEYLAFKEYLESSGRSYEYLFFNLYTRQSGVIITN